MGKGKKKNRKTQPKSLPAENESEKQASASAVSASNPVESQPNFTSLQSSVLPTGEVSPLEALRKKMSDLEISESAAQKDEQQKPGSQSGTNLNLLHMVVLNGLDKNLTHSISTQCQALSIKEVNQVETLN